MMHRHLLGLFPTVRLFIRSGKAAQILPIAIARLS
jgi:hypothetical protein